MERTSGFRNIRRVCGRLIVMGALSATLAVAASAAAERTLAGIKIFSPMSQVLKKYGTPTEVRVGGQSTSTNGSTSGTGNGYGPGGAGPGGPGGLPGFGGPQGGPGGRGPYGGSPYGGGANSDDSDDSGTGYGQSSTTLGVAIQSNMVTWIYDLEDGGSLEFTFSSDGRVIQIHATGLKGNERTAKGAGLGMKLSQVMQLYGFPERQFIANRILHTSYIDKFHVAFQFYHQKLVGIIVAAVD